MKFKVKVTEPNHEDQSLFSKRFWYLKELKEKGISKEHAHKFYKFPRSFIEKYWD